MIGLRYMASEGRVMILGLVGAMFMVAMMSQKRNHRAIQPEDLPRGSARIWVSSTRDGASVQSQ